MLASIPTFTLLLLLLLVSSQTVSGQGNGNLKALRTTPYDEVIPIPNFPPPPHIHARIHYLIYAFFNHPRDQTEAEEILSTIWYFNPIYSMLAMMDRMEKHNYAYAEYGEECTDDSGGDEKKAMEIQEHYEKLMKKPKYISTRDYFFWMPAWWEIVGNTVENLWRENQIIADKICDQRRRGLVCVKNATGQLHCDCPKTANGIQMVAVNGGICGIERNKPCNYTTASRLMSDVFDTEIRNEKQTSKTCFGNSFCSGDLNDNNITKCTCWSLLAIDSRAKRSVLLNSTIGGERCHQVEEQKLLKHAKWDITMTILWISIPLFGILAPHWDDIYYRILPGYYNHIKSGRRRPLPKRLPPETCDVKMNPEVKNFIETYSTVLDINDPDYYEKVDAVDDKPVDPLSCFVTVPHCTDYYYHFEWPRVNKLEVWF